MSVAFIIIFILAMQNWFIRCGGCSIINFCYNSSGIQREIVIVNSKYNYNYTIIMVNTITSI